MEYKERHFLSTSTQQDSGANFRESIEFSATSNIFGFTNPPYLLLQEVSNSADVSLVQVAEYRLMNDPILNEGTFTSNDELFAQSTQAIPQYDGNGLPLTSDVEAGHPQLVSNSFPPETHQNAVLHTAASSALQYIGDEPDSSHLEFCDSLEAPLENVPCAAIGDHPVNDFNLDQISGRNENVASAESFHVSDAFPLTNEPINGSPVQQFFSLIEDAGLDTTTDLQCPLTYTNPAPMNDDSQDQDGMSPEDKHFMFPEQMRGRIPTGTFSGVESMVVNYQNELQDQQKTSFLHLDAQNDLCNAGDSIEQGTEQERISLLMEDEISTRYLTTEQLSENGENLSRDQTTISTHVDELETKTSTDAMGSAEKIRMVFLYPMYSQMKDYQKRCANSPRARRRKTDAKYYALKRLQQDVRENLEIAQKASVVSRQLHLEREQVQKDLEKERREVSRLRFILEKYAVGKRT